MSHPVHAGQPMPSFNRELAFSRTLGFVTPAELDRLKHCKIAIAGLGGVGGAHLEVLTRLGIGAFHIADFDKFELQNFNRQSGAYMSTLNAPKTQVSAAIARDINPEVAITSFEEGITEGNIDAFLDGVDLYVDSLDFYAIEARAMIFAACYRKNIPAITVAPLGMGAGLLNILPGGISFEDYFRWEGQPREEKLMRFMVGLAPKALQRHYIVWPEAVDVLAGRSTSTPMGASLCAGVAGSEALKILLKRGRVYALPHAITFDAYFNRTVHCWTPGGIRNPLMRLRLMIVRRVLKRMAKAKKTA